MSLVTLLGLGIVVFASTNIDDIFVLLGFLADPHFRVRNVATGQYLGFGVLALASVVASTISVVLIPAHVGLLGVLPILIGIARLLAFWRTETGNEESKRRVGNWGSLQQIGTVATVTIANGGDNLGIYTPLFATQAIYETVIVLIVFAIMTGLWVGLAYWLVRHPTAGYPIRRYGHIFVPFLFIGLGLIVLSDAGSLDLLRRTLVWKS